MAIQASFLCQEPGAGLAVLSGGSTLIPPFFLLRLTVSTTQLSMAPLLGGPLPLCLASPKARSHHGVPFLLTPSESTSLLPMSLHPMDPNHSSPGSIFKCQIPSSTGLGTGPTESLHSLYPLSAKNPRELLFHYRYYFMRSPS